jgi:hypothetical protein
MKKVLAVFDGSNFSEAAFNFILRYPNEKNLLLVGVFLSSIDYETLFGYHLELGGYVTTAVDDYETIALNMQRFKTLCEKNDISYRVHGDVGEDALKQLRKETRFADLLIISSELFYRNAHSEKQSSQHLEDIMKYSECPILLLPETFDFPRTNVLAYDGSESSTYAIKQFSYLFPQLRGNPTRVVYASKQAGDLPEQVLVEELAARHFGNLSLQKLDFEPETYFNTWIANKKDTILVTGSFSKDGLAGLLHKSFIQETINDHRLPIFVAHK